MLPLSFLFLSLAHVAAFVDTSHAHGLRVARLKLHDEANASLPSLDKVGDLTCMRWSGGICSYSACKPERGPTVCEGGYCMCQPGTCATGDGSCQSNSEGKVIGDYAISFLHPHKTMQHTPYIGVDASVAGDGYIFGSPVVGHMAGLAGTANSEKQWRVILTHHGHVRFTNLKFPGSVLTLRMIKKKGDIVSEPHRLLQIRGGLRDQSATLIPDSDNVVPVLVQLQTVTPRQADFQVRPTHQDGGGLEIWDPEIRAALASGNPSGWFKDSVADAGVAECDVDHVHRSSWSGECEGRQLVAFDPALPAEARAEGARHYILQIAPLYSWQSFLIICFCIVVCLGRMALGPGHGSGGGHVFVGGGGGY